MLCDFYAQFFEAGVLNTLLTENVSYGQGGRFLFAVPVYAGIPLALPVLFWVPAYAGTTG
jgi:hypothetical protein